MSKTAITPTRAQDFPEWFQQVIQAAELADNTPVRGCMVIKPYGYAIWENIQRLFDARIKKLGVQNAYFPLLIPVEYIAEEAEHIEGFAKECAVVTHHRLTKDVSGKLVPDGKLNEPFVIRPTSEVIIGKIISKWIQTYKDLPMKLNQWCNVMRWEMRPRLFLRTSEFLWQEGHTVFAREEEAIQDARLMLDTYCDFLENDLALPVIKGEKTPEEKFPGAVSTYTMEMMMQDGKALQAGTSHYLGQSFSKAFDIKYVGSDNKEHLSYTCSWGITTRLIGGLVMVHADDDGLVLPPAIAPYHVVIIPIVHNEENKDRIFNYVSDIQEKLDSLGVRVHVDSTANTTPNKIWKWIKRGVPIRMEVGIKEVEQGVVTCVRRDLGAPSKQALSDVSDIPAMLKDYENNIRNKATAYRDNNSTEVASLDEIDALYQKDFKGFIKILREKTENLEFESIAKKYSLSRRCIPLDSPDYVIIAKSY